jgi:hypothetical protein
MSDDTSMGGSTLHESGPTILDGEMAEFSLLLPGWQAAALEATAHAQGLTAGQMVRRLIQDYFARFAHPRKLRA